MKNKLYGIFDGFTMLFSPLVENLFDHAEVWSAHRGAHSGKRRRPTSSAASTRGSESLGW